MMQNFQITLKEMPTPSGEIELADLASISGRLQELSTRVSRWVADIDGAGRSPSSVSEAASLRFAGARPGSTILQIRVGSHDTLDMETPYEHEFANRFWAVLAAIGTDMPPEDAPPTVRESALQLLEALGHAAPLVAVTRADGVSVEFRPAERDRDVWDAEVGDLDEETVTVVGILEAVDIKSGRFRIADDVGHRIRLDDVADAPSAARLIGERVVANGTITRERRRGPMSIDGATVSSAVLPESLTIDRDAPAWTPPEGYVGPDMAVVIELDDDEWARFLEALETQ